MEGVPELEGGWLLVLVLVPTSRPANMPPALPAAAAGAAASPPSKSPALLHITFTEHCMLYVGYMGMEENCHSMQRGMLLVPKTWSTCMQLAQNCPHARGWRHENSQKARWLPRTIPRKSCEAGAAAGMSASPKRSVIKSGTAAAPAAEPAAA